MNLFTILSASFRRRAEGFYALAAIHAVNTFVMAIFLSIVFTRDASALVAVSGIRNFIGFCAAITAVFSVALSRLIAGYVMEGRRKELATWLLLGMRKRLAFAVTSGEFIISFALADVLALSLAAILNRYFALLLGFVTREGRAIDMSTNGKVVLAVMAISVVQAAGISASVFRTVRRSSIKELFLRAPGGFAAPNRAGWRCAIGAGLIGVGYTCAAASGGRVAVYALIPTLALVVAGTFPFMDGLVRLRDLLRRRRYLSDAARLIAYSVESRRASRDALVLSITAILLASASTAGGAMFAMGANADVQARRSCPNAAELSGLDGAALETVADEVDVELASSGDLPATRRIISTLPVRLTIGTGVRRKRFDAEAIPRTLWAALMRESGRTPPPLSSNVDIIFSADDDPTVVKASGSFAAEILSGGSVHVGHLSWIKEAYVLSCTYAPRVAVIADEAWRRLSSDPGAAPFRKIAVWNGGRGDSLDVPLGAALRRAAAEEAGARILVHSEEEELFLREAGAMRFIGVFLAAVFLFAAVATVAFKFFQDEWHDRGNRRLLASLGMNTVVGRRASIILLIDAYAPPLALSCLHTSFAIKMLGSITRFDVAFPAALVTLSTATVYALSSIAIAWRYLRPATDA